MDADSATHQGDTSRPQTDPQNSPGAGAAGDTQKQATAEKAKMADLVADAVGRASGDRSVPTEGAVKRAVRELPADAILELWHWAKLQDGYVFTAREGSPKWYHILAKHGQTRAVHDALRRFEDQLADAAAKEHPSSAPAEQHTSTKPKSAQEENQRLQGGYELVSERVILKDKLSWEDLVQLRRSRSVYLGRRFLDQYETTVAKPLLPEGVREGAVLFARNVRLTPAGLSVVNGLDGIEQYPPDHPLARAAADVAATLKAERQVDPVDIDSTAGRLCHKDESDRRNFLPPDMASRTAEEAHEPSDQELSGVQNPEPEMESSAEPAEPGERRMPRIDPLSVSGFRLPTPISALPPFLLEHAAERLTEQQLEQLHKAMKFLAGADDGAQRRDGQGFNKNDTEVGQRLAEKDKLSWPDAALARLFVVVYGKAQFEKHPELQALRAAMSSKALNAQPVLREVDTSAETYPHTVETLDLGTNLARHLLTVRTARDTYLLCFIARGAEVGGIVYRAAAPQDAKAFTLPPNAPKSVRVGERIPVVVDGQTYGLGPVTGPMLLRTPEARTREAATAPSAASQQPSGAGAPAGDASSANGPDVSQAGQQREEPRSGTRPAEPVDPHRVRFVGGKHGVIRVGAKLHNVPDVDYHALRALKGPRGILCVLSSSIDDAGVLHILKLSLNGVETELPAVTKAAVQQSGVPTPPLVREPAAAAKHLRQIAGELLPESAPVPASPATDAPPLEAESEAADPGTPVISQQEAPSLHTSSDFCPADANLTAPDVGKNAALLQKQPSMVPSI